DPAFTISGLPGPCIHYIWSPRTLHPLYLVSPDPAFIISGLPGPRIHYIWSPTVHITWKCNYFIKYKLNTFSHQKLEQSCDFSRALVKACRRSFYLAL
ncbi:unnamed protein product, partial [Staurois parvus]